MGEKKEPGCGSKLLGCLILLAGIGFVFYKVGGWGVNEIREGHAESVRQQQAGQAVVDATEPGTLERMRAVIMQDMGECNRAGVKRVREIKFHEGDAVIAVSLDMPLTASQHAYGGKDTILRVLGAWKEAGYPGENLSIVLFAEYMDEYEKTSDQAVVIVKYSEAVVEKINFANHIDIVDGIYNLAESTSILPEFQ